MQMKRKTLSMPIRTTSARLTEGKTGCSSRRRRSATVTTTAGTSLMRKAARGCLVRWGRLLLMSEVVLLVSACEQDMMWLQNIYPDLQLSEFRCKNGEKCIQQYQKCNHRSKPLLIPPKLLNPALSVVNITKNLCRAECSDGSDEEDCSKCSSSF